MMEEQDIIKLSEKLVALNIIREELIKSELCPKQKIFYEYNVYPLLLSLYYLSYSTLNFSHAASFLNTMNFGKVSQIKELLDLVKGLQGISEDVLHELEKQLQCLIKIYKNP
ncbi:hypothetical protein ACER0A_003895 [Haloimpatiens sp. FM7315]|uniref:hypothetical protein n=1 Tax=Haloimpatiens sp. FM7315 TaxID=3298609 RepID=UPI0035A33909